MEVFLLWLIFIVLVAWWAGAWGRSVGWAVVGGVLLSPLIWAVVLLVLGRKPQAEPRSLHPGRTEPETPLIAPRSSQPLRADAETPLIAPRPAAHVARPASRIEPPDLQPLPLAESNARRPRSNVTLDESNRIRCPACEHVFAPPSARVPDGAWLACPRCRAPLSVFQPPPPKPKLRPCPACTREVSLRAATCPHCGDPLSD